METKPIKTKTIPVTRGFNQAEPPIGKLLLRDDVEIPYGSVFALGGIVLERDDDGTITKFELQEVSLIPDENYVRYIQREKQEKNRL